MIRTGARRTAVVLLPLAVVTLSIGAFASGLRYLGMATDPSSSGDVFSARNDVVIDPSRIAENGPGISAGRIAAPPAQTYSGVFSPGVPLTLASLDLGTGSYSLSYFLDARFSGSLISSSSVDCEIVEASSGIPLEPQEASTVRTSEGWTTISRAIDVDLPAMTIELRCTPAQGGPAVFDTQYVQLQANSE